MGAPHDYGSFALIHPTLPNTQVFRIRRNPLDTFFAGSDLRLGAARGEMDGI
jgi:hypothetical protein